MSQPLEVNLDITPTSRFELIDVAERVREKTDNSLARFRRAMYCSLHTTAGYLEQGTSARLGHSRHILNPFFQIFQRVFPPDAGYYHDRMQLREELSEKEKECEPINADSHLTFIGAGLKNCVTYDNRPGVPVYFVELDGIYQDVARRRRTTVLGYDTDQVVYRGQVDIPVVSGRMIEALNLKDPRHGLFEQLEEWLDAHGVERGRIDVRLAPEERDAGLTVNEYETLLIRNDLPEVLRDPLRYMVRRTRGLLRNPTAIPGKTRDYATYDLIHLYNELMDSLPIGRQIVDRVLSVLSSPAYRLLRFKRHISLLVSTSQETGPDRIVQGTYQTPILVQRHRADGDIRTLDITVRRFE